MAAIMDKEDRFRRFNAAKSTRDQWNGLLRNAYQLSLPNKDQFFTTTTVGDTRTRRLFDSTALDAVQTFANNMQTALMPPFQRWANLEAAVEVAPEDRLAVNKALSETNEIVFEFINRSNFAQVINESFQELAIGTGVIVLNEGTLSDPLQFMSVPIANVFFAAGRNHTLTDFWMEWKGTPRLMMRQWPKAILSKELGSRVKGEPDSELNLIVGSILNDETNRYFYYVGTEGGQHDIVFEERDFSPFTGFRFSRVHGETMGRGPVLTALPFIRVANEIVEFSLKAASFIAYPPFMAASTATMNPFTVQIEPGSIIAVNPTATLGGGPPIQSLQAGGNLEFANFQLDQMQKGIQNILFATPLPETGGPQMTATEISIRQDHAIRQRTAAFGRLITELVRPIYNNILIVLEKQGKIDRKKIGVPSKIRFESPLAQVQAKADVQRAQDYLTIMTQDFQELAVATIDFANYPEWVAGKLNVDPLVVNGDWKTSGAVQQIQNAAEGQQQQQQQQPPQGAPQAPGQPQQSTQSGAPPEVPGMSAPVPGTSPGGFNGS